MSNRSAEQAIIVVVAIVAGLVGLVVIGAYYDVTMLIVSPILAGVILGVIELQNRRKRARGQLPPRRGQPLPPPTPEA